MGREEPKYYNSPQKKGDENYDVKGGGGRRKLHT